MQFERSGVWEKAGFYLGLLISYCVFTVVLFVILRHFNKLPWNWTVVHFAGITLAVLAAGYIIERLLK